LYTWGVDTQSNCFYCSSLFDVDVVLDVSGIYGLGPSHLELGNTTDVTTNGTVHPPSQQSSIRKDGAENSVTDDLVGTLISQAPAEDLEEDMIDPDSAYDSESASVIRLSNGMVSLTMPTLCDLEIMRDRVLTCCESRRCPGLL
jgi:hypothetical protein